MNSKSSNVGSHSMVVVKPENKKHQIPHKKTVLAKVPIQVRKEISVILRRHGAAIKKAASSGLKLNASTFGFSNQEIHTMRQIYYPTNAGSFTISGTGASYNATIGRVSFSSTDAYWSLFFQLNDLPQASTFGSLFDQYRLEKCVVHFHPSFNISEAINEQFCGLNYIVRDFDDATVPTSRPQLFEYENCLGLSQFKPFTVSVAPRVAIGAYDGSFTGYANQPSQWTDLNSPQVQHYGLKGVFCAANTTGFGVTYDIFVESWWSFRSVR